MTVGIFSIGLDTYWGQFDGLLDKLTGYHETIVSRIEGMGARVVDAGMVDNLDKAQSAADLFSSSDVDLLFVFISTYALSATVLPVIQRAKVPVVLLNIQPVAQLDYKSFNAMNDRGKMTGVWLEHCQACSVPELACVFNRADITYDIVTGHMADEDTWGEIEAWVSASRVAAGMQRNRVGILGNYYNGMLDVYTDITRQAAAFGNSFEIVEMCALAEIRANVSDEEISGKIEEFAAVFDVSDDCDPSEMERAARTAVALKKLVDTHKLGSMAYYYEGIGEYQEIVTSVIAGNTLLTGSGIPVAGECEVKNVQAMKILDLFGAGGSFAEFYLMDLKDDIVFLGHDGPAHFAIADKKVGLVPLPVYHGKPGKGLSIQMSVRNGPVTILSVVETRDGEVILQVAEGESVPGDVLQIGNTNGRYRFPIGAKAFINGWSKGGPSHHCAIGVGHIADRIGKLGTICGIEVRQVC